MLQQAVLPQTSIQIRDTVNSVHRAGRDSSVVFESVDQFSAE